MDKADLVQLLVGREPEAIIQTLAMMAYNPAIGRVLEKGGVVKFANLMSDMMVCTPEGPIIAPGRRGQGGMAKKLVQALGDDGEARGDDGGWSDTQQE